MSVHQQVLVMLDRETAEARVFRGAEPFSHEEMIEMNHRLDGAIRAALDRDPDALVEQVARAIWKATSVHNRYSDYDQRIGPGGRRRHLRMARAALAALSVSPEGEGPDN